MKKNKLETKIKKIISKKDKKNDEYNFLLKKIKKMENRLEVLEDKLLKDVESNSKNDEEFYKNDNEVKESVNLDKKNDENIKLEIVEEKNDEVKYDEFLQNRRSGSTFYRKLSSTFPEGG